MTRGLFVGINDVEHFFAIYRAALSTLKQEAPDLFGAMPERAAETDDAERPRMLLDRVRALLRDVRFCVEALLPPPAVQVALTATREGAFFAGQRSDALRVVLDIVALARTKLEVIDGYVDLGTLSVLTREPKVVVEILTRPLDANTVTAFVTHARGRQLRVRTSTDFHDRFICVDERDVYHFGASIKDAGARGFMFSRVEEPTVIKALRDEWARVWNAATVVV